MKNELLNSFFLDFKLWIYSKYDIQLRLFQTLSQWILEKKPGFEIIVNLQVFSNFFFTKKTFLQWKSFGVQGFLDAIRNFYWEAEDPQSKLQIRELFLHPITKGIIGRRPPFENRTALRFTIHSIIKLLIREYSPLDLQAICSALLVNNDSKQQIEFLELLKESLSELFIERFLFISGPYYLMALFTSNNDIVRSNSLKLLVKLYQKQQSTPKKSKVYDLSTLGDLM